MFGTLLYDMGRYDLSLSYLEKLLNNPEEEDLASIHFHIGRVLSIQGDLTNEWKHYEQAYQIWTKSESKRNHDVLIHMGEFIIQIEIKHSIILRAHCRYSSRSSMIDILNKLERYSV